MILHLGVIELPYNDKASITTADVATILEEKYGVMQTFVDLHEDDIIDALEESILGAIDNIVAGAPTMQNPFADGEAEIENLFKFSYLEQGEAEGIAPNTPTKASIDRQSLRFKSGKSKGKRPSFIDTSTYENSFKAWIEE